MHIALEHETDRLLLRQWRESDRVPFAEMNDDDRVMRSFPRHYRRDESDQFIDFNARCLSELGWGNLAVELKSSRQFAGFVGLSKPPEWHPCAGRLEIGWRLAPEVWGAGFATEAARSVALAGFDSIGLDEIISYTAARNLPSIGVMRKLGMRKEGSFDHPRIPSKSELCKHDMYVLDRSELVATFAAQA